VSRKEHIIHVTSHILFVVLYGLLIVFSILFFNSAGLAAALYVGFIILVSGIIILLWSSQSRRKGRASGEEGISKGILVESGMYGFVRNPEFLGHILIISGLLLIAQRWFSLIIGSTLISLLYLAIIEEEKKDIEKFGNTYRDFMQSVPRINFLAGIIRHYKKEKGKPE
jgi:protein-S-isoprenylcysteine O-methyltransferase Ste14